MNTETSIKLYDKPLSDENNQTLPCEQGVILLDGCVDALVKMGKRKSVLLYSTIMIDGVVIPRDQWETRRVAPGENVVIYKDTFGGGGIFKAILGALLMISGAALMWWNPAWYVAAAGMLAAGIGSSLLGNALAPKPKLPSATTAIQDDTKSYSTSGASNQFRPWETLPVVIGTMRSVPDQCATPYELIVNGEQVVRQLFCVSAGDVEVWDVRGGTTALETMGVRYRIHRNWKGGALSYFNKKMQIDNANFKLDNTFVRTSGQNCIQISFIVYFYQGLNATKKQDGVRTGQTVQFLARYVNTQTGATYQRTFVTSSDTRTTHRAQFSNSLPAGTYTVYVDARVDRSYSYQERVIIGYTDGQWMGPGDDLYWEPPRPIYKYETRYVENYINASNYEDNDYYYTLECHITQAQFEIDQPVLTPSKFGMTLIEIEAQASDRLSGSIGNLNCMARRLGTIWNGSSLQRVATSNCAAQALSLLTDKDLCEDIDYTPIDYKSFADHYVYCEKYGWQCNDIETQGRELGVVAQECLKVGQGFVNRTGGVIKVYYDDPNREYVDVITPRNSWGVKIINEKPIVEVDGIRAIFTNERMDYQQDERIIYSPGTTEATARNVFSVQMKKITNPDGVWKEAMLIMSGFVHRNNTFQFYTDWRSIDYGLGDKIRFQNNMVFIGSGSAKVVDYKYNDSGYITDFVMDQYFDMEVGKSYTVRNTTKRSTQYFDIRPTGENENTNILRLMVPIQKSQKPPLFTLLSVGETTKDTVALLIRKIERQKDYVALIDAIPAAPEYLDALSGTIPPFKSYLTNPSYFDTAKPNAPVILSYVADESAAVLKSGGVIMLNVNLAMSYTTKDGVEWSSYYVRWRKEGETDYKSLVWTKNDYEIIIEDVEQAAWYEIDVRTVSKSGVSSDSSRTRVYIQGLLTPPPPPDAVLIDDTNMTIIHSNPPVDLTHYEIWMAYDEQDEVWQGQQIGISVDKTFNLAPFVGRARRVFVRSVDRLDIKSTWVNLAVELGDVLPENVILEISELGRAWPGDIVLGKLINNRMFADSKNPLWPDDDLPLWPADDLPLWPSADAEPMRYEYELDVPKFASGSTLSVTPVFEQGAVSKIEIARQFSEPLWPADDQPLWPSDDLPLWKPTTWEEFKPLTNVFVVGADLKLKIRVTFATGQAAIVSDIITGFDVPDVEHYVADMYVESTGTRIPIPQGKFRVISYVQLTLQSFDGSLAVSAEVIDKLGQIDSNGFLTQGPLVAGLTGNRTKTRALVDVSMKGY